MRRHASAREAGAAARLRCPHAAWQPAACAWHFIIPHCGGSLNINSGPHKEVSWISVVTLTLLDCVPVTCTTTPPFREYCESTEYTSVTVSSSPWFITASWML